MSILSRATGLVGKRARGGALASSVALIAALALSSPASADVRWVLNDVTFDDGGTVSSGVFTVDTAGYVSNSAPALITTTGGSTLPGNTYAGPSSGGINTMINEGSGDNILTLFLLTPPPGYSSYYGEINLEFEYPLNVSRPVNPIVAGSPGPSWECLGWSCPNGTIRYVTGGSAAIPEPSTWALMALGFAGLGFAGWRAARRDASATL